jgi:hypothetical protein
MTNYNENSEIGSGSPLPQLRSGQFQVSVAAQIALTYISEIGEGIHISDIVKNIVGDEIPKDTQVKYDNALGELIHLKLVRIGQDGKIYITSNGERAVDKRIAVSYPLNNHVHSFDDTLLTQTQSAGDALTYSIANNHKWISDRSPQALSSILKSLSMLGAHKVLNTPLLIAIQKEYFKETIEKTRFKNLNRIFGTQISTLRNACIDNICDIGSDITLKNAIPVDDAYSVVSIKADAEQPTALLKNVFDDQVVERNLNSLNIECLLEIVNSLN